MLRLPQLTPRDHWLVLAAFCAAIAGTSLVLTAWLNLHPCHLCIFQRLLYMLLAGAGLAAGLLSPRQEARWVGAAGMALAATGLMVALYQSWLQLQPPGSVSCMGSDPGLIERLVEWLARLQPELFLATGFCEQAEWTLLKLSLANWSVLCFSFCLVLGYRAWRTPPVRRIFRT